MIMKSTNSMQKISSPTKLQSSTLSYKVQHYQKKVKTEI